MVARQLMKFLCAQRAATDADRLTASGACELVWVEELICSDGAINYGKYDVQTLLGSFEQSSEASPLS